MQHWKRSTATVGALLLASACGTGRVNPDDVLWTPATARSKVYATTEKVDRRIYRDGSTSVYFSVKTDDHERITTDLIEHFERLGWRRRATEWFAPRQPTSFATGWIHHCSCIVQVDAAGRPIPNPPDAYDWRGEWQDADSNVITYYLAAAGDDVRGSGGFLPIRLILKVLGRRGR